MEMTPEEMIQDVASGLDRTIALLKEGIAQGKDATGVMTSNLEMFERSRAQHLEKFGI
jgi:hypothetical protein